MRLLTQRQLRCERLRVDHLPLNRKQQVSVALQEGLQLAVDLRERGSRCCSAAQTAAAILLQALRIQNKLC